MKTYKLILLLVLLGGIASAQVGINTVSPNALLDVRASNIATPLNTDGLLIPKIDEFPGTAPTAAQDGMMVFVTGAGTPPRGFYYWNQSGSSWVLFTGNTEWTDNGPDLSPLAGVSKDVSIGGANNTSSKFTVRSNKNITGLFTNTTSQDTYMWGVNSYLNNASTNVNAQTRGNYNDVLTAGGSAYGDYNNVRGAGDGTHYGEINLLSGEGDGNHYGVSSVLSGVGSGTQYGMYNSISNTGSGDHTGISNNLSGVGSGSQIGVRTNINNTGNSLHTGMWNDLSGSGSGPHFAIYNTLSGDGSGIHYGIHNSLTGVANGTKYGSYNKVASSAGGQHYGVYSEALKVGAFSGYFLGSVAIGTTTANTYTLPSARGANAQIMQTDGSGNVSWVSPSAIGSWSVTGNSGTNPATQFVGTVDSVSVAIRTNNIEKWRFTTLGQLEFNNNNGNGFDNILIGQNAGNTAAASSGGHTFVGNGTGQNIGTGAFWNTYIGLEAGANSSDGNVNTFLGTFAGKANTIGSANTFLGKDAAFGNTTGDGNIAIGQKSASGLVSGNFNVYIGQLLDASNEGDNNVVIGNRAYIGNGPNSNNNVILGFQGGGSITGANNILIGGNSLEFPSNTGSNQLTIGNLIYGVNVDGTANTISSGNIGIGVQTPLDKLDVGGTLRVSTSNVNAAQFRNDDNFNHQSDNNIDFGDDVDAWMVSSRDGTNENSGIYGGRDFVTVWAPADSGRMIRFLDEDGWSDDDGDPYNNAAELAYIDNAGQFVQASDKNRKQNIVKISSASEKIKQINGYTYAYKLSASEKQKGGTSRKTSGVLAQELFEVLPEAVQINENGEYFVHYAGIIPLLIEGAKEQQKVIEELKTQLSHLKNLEARLTALENNPTR